MRFVFLEHLDSNCCCYCFCGPARATTFIVLSPNYEDIATFVRRACRWELTTLIKYVDSAVVKMCGQNFKLDTVIFRFLGKVLLFIKKLTNNKYLLLFINNIFFL